MMKSLVFFSLLMIFVPGAHAIENLGPSCELHLRTSPDFAIADQVSVELTANDVLIRGTLMPYWEPGMEDYTRWSIRDEDYDKKVNPSFHDSLYQLRTGDRLYILDPNGKLMGSGVYRERKVTRVVTSHLGTVEAHPNMPGLYKDGNDKSQVIGMKRLVELFRSESVKAVVVRNLSGPAKAKMIEKLAPKFARYYSHMFSERRYLKVSPELSLEIAYFEEAFQGSFGFSTTEKSNTNYNPRTNSVTVLAPEIALKPHLKMGPTGKLFVLKEGDELVLLDLLGAKLGHLKMTSDSLTGTHKPGETFADLRALFKLAQKAVVIRKRSPNFY